MAGEGGAVRGVDEQASEMDVRLVRDDEVVLAVRCVRARGDVGGERRHVAPGHHLEGKLRPLPSKRRWVAPEVAPVAAPSPHVTAPICSMHAMGGVGVGVWLAKDAVGEAEAGAGVDAGTLRAPPREGPLRSK